MDPKDIIAPPPAPWAVRRFGLTHYVTRIPRCLAGLAIGAFVGAVINSAFFSVFMPIADMQIPMSFFAQSLFDTFFLLLIGMSVVAILPWIFLHFIGFRGPISAIILGPALLHATRFEQLFMPHLGTFVCAVAGLVVWRVAYRKFEFTIDADVFA